MEKLSKQEMFEAVKEGVKEALFTMIEAGDGSSSDRPIIREQFLQAIKDGTRIAIEQDT